MSGSQIILGALVVFIFFKTFQNYRKKNITRLFASLWLLFWTMVLIAVFNPFLTTKLAHLVGVGRGVDLVVYLSIIIIFYSLFRILVKQKELEQMITKIVRKLADK